MLKLVLCLVSSLFLAVLVLHLRQQRLEINHQANQLHNEVEEQQARLWNQQLEIAVYTAPNAIAHTVGNHELKMVPRAPLPAEQANWVDVAEDPRAE